LRLGIRGRVEVDRAQHQARRRDVFRRAVALELAGALGAAHMTAAHVLVDTVQRRRFVLGQRRLDGLFHPPNASVANLAPLAEAAMIDVQVRQGLADLRMLIVASLRDLALGLAAIKLLGHTDLSPRNDPDAVGVGLIGGTGDLGVVQRRLAMALASSTSAELRASRSRFAARARRAGSPSAAPTTLSPCRGS